MLDNPQGDLASALAIGFAAARGDYVAKLDAHTFFPAGYVSAGVRRLERGGTNWVSGPPGPVRRRCGLATRGRPARHPPRRRRLRQVGAGGENEWSSTRASSPASGPATCSRASAHWDPEWPVNEDAELALRFLADDERLVCLAAMAARYVPRGTLKGLARQYGRYGYYRAKTAGRHPRSLRRSHLPLCPALAAAVAVFALGGRPGRRLAGGPAARLRGRRRRPSA